MTKQISTINKINSNDKTRDCTGWLCTVNFVNETDFENLEKPGHQGGSSFR